MRRRKQKAQHIGQCRACSSNSHLRSNHKDCPFNKRRKTNCPLMKTPDHPCADTDMYDSDVSLDQEVVDIDVCDASSSLSDMEGTDVDNGPQCNCGADSTKGTAP